MTIQSSLPQSAIENMAYEGKRMKRLEEEARKALNIPDDAEIELVKTWDGDCKVWVNGQIRGYYGNWRTFK